jgi:hypothetical protein
MHGTGYNEAQRNQDDNRACPAPNPSGAYYGESPVTTKEAGLRDLLYQRINRAQNDTEKLAKAIRILKAHPEFEDLLWLIRSGLV